MRLCEFFFFVLPAQVLVHLGEREPGAGEGEVSGEGQEFGGHLYMLSSEKNEPQMNADERRLVELSCVSMFYFMVFIINLF